MFIVLYFIECIVMVVNVCVCVLHVFVSVCVFTQPGKNSYANWFRV